MNYRLYIAAKEDTAGTQVAFAFYNHHDACVYHRVVFCADKREKEAYISVAASALGYFAGHMRNRYYDEHFATLLDEDGVVFYTEDRGLCDAYASFSKEKEASLGNYEAFRPYFETRSMGFSFLECTGKEQEYAEGLLRSSH